MALIGVFALGACANSGSPVVDSIRAAVRSGFGDAANENNFSGLDPRFRYLRVEVPGFPSGLMVLGYVDPHPDGPIEVWYSGTREALRLQSGRIVGTTGALHDWLSVQHAPAPPAWDHVPQGGSIFTRQRDAMPGYRYGVREKLRLVVWNGTPAIDLPETMPPELSRDYQWFRESVETLAGRSEMQLPNSWFAWGKHQGEETIVYSEQCLAPDFCLKLQRWPVTGGTP